MANNSDNSSLTANESQTSMTESKIMSEETVHSTPVISKRTEENDIVKIMQTLFEIQNNKFDEKFNELKEQNRDLKSDINEIKRQNCNFAKRFDELHMKRNKVDDNSKSREIDKLNINKDKVSSGENCDKINKNMVLEDNNVEIGNDNEILMRVEVNGEEIVVDELSLIHI